MHVEQTGGDTNDWLSIIDAGELGTGDGRNSNFLFKSFNITEMGINFETDFQMFIETQCNASTDCPSAFAQTILHGKFNRYSSELFPDGEQTINSPVNVTNTITSRSGSSISLVMGGGVVFDPQFVRYSPNIKEVLNSANPDFVTIMFRWDSNSLDGVLDINNFTVTNSTTFDFTNTILNFTSDDANCQLQDGGLGVFRTSADECDNGTVFVSNTPHLEFKQAINTTSDWQFKEFQNNGAVNGWSYWEFHSNSTGLIINTTNAVVDNKPGETGNFYLFKTFTPTSATTQLNMTIVGENNPTGALEFVTLKASELIGDSQFDGRWNSTTFQSNVLESVTNIGAAVNTGPVPFTEKNIGVAVDTSSHIGIPISIAVIARDNSNVRDATILIKDIKMGGEFYDFANAIIKFESEGTTGELGLISARFFGLFYLSVQVWHLLHLQYF